MNRRRKPFNTGRFVSVFFSFLTVFFWVNFGSEFICYFLPKTVFMVVSNKKVPSRIINGGNKLLSSFTKTFKVLDVIGLRHFNLFVFDIFSHIGQRLVDVVGIRDKIFQQSVKKIGWKLLSHSSGSIGQLELYSNWMLMMSSLSTQGKLEVLRASTSIEIYCSLWEITGSTTILT